MDFFSLWDRRILKHSTKTWTSSCSWMDASAQTKRVKHDHKHTCREFLQKHWGKMNERKRLQDANGNDFRPQTVLRNKLTNSFYESPYRSILLSVQSATFQFSTIFFHCPTFNGSCFSRTFIFSNFVSAFLLSNESLSQKPSTDKLTQF